MCTTTRIRSLDNSWESTFDAVSTLDSSELISARVELAGVYHPSLVSFLGHEQHNASGIGLFEFPAQVCHIEQE